MEKHPEIKPIPELKDTVNGACYSFPAFKSRFLDVEDKPAFIGRQMKKEEQLMSKQEEKDEYDWLVLHKMEFTHLAERAQHYLGPAELTQLNEFIKKNPVIPP